MWYTWMTLLLVSCALVEAAEVEVTTTEAVVPLTTVRPPPRTLDRHGDELVWNTWLQSPENRNSNGPRRRITTKSLFITPLVCPKGQRLDGNGCVQTVTVNKDEHERNLLEELNAQFKPTTSGDITYYDIDDENEPGPLQLSIPIGLDPLAAPFQGQEPSDQAQVGNHGNIDKKDKPDTDASIEAELELLKLQQSRNDTGLPDGVGVLNHNVLTNFHFPEKPKRDTPLNATEIESLNNMADQGQKEVVYGHVNVDPVLYGTETQQELDNTKNNNVPKTENTLVVNATTTESDILPSTTEESQVSDVKVSSQTVHVLKKEDKSKLNPENDYSDIGEAIKLISRYAEVTTDDNFSKDQKNQQTQEDGILGTRTKLQHRRNKPQSESAEILSGQISPDLHNTAVRGDYVDSGGGVIYRYPWPNQQFQPPPNYPFHHLQDYWSGQNKPGGVYNTHENPRRHHHSYPHNFRTRGYVAYPGMESYPEQLRRYIHRIVQHHANAQRSHSNQDLYSLLGLRHWFSSEDSTKR